jgi:hypothetical protein
MKILLITLLLLSTLCSKAQLKLAKNEFTNLIAISELYSKNTNANGENFVNAIDSLRTPTLNNIVDALIEVGKGEKTIFTSRFLSRPSETDLTMWYVIREIHYNMTSKNPTPRPNIDVANEVLSKKIDERWLLDNYYNRIHGGIGLLFNTADLSKIDINIETLGLKNETEKAIFYFNMMDALIGGRFKVLQMMKNNQKILYFSDKLPLFNGKKYFYYKNFDFKDFDWIGYEKTESYSERYIGNLYGILIAQYLATFELRSKQETQEMYFNSILSEPKYFKYSAIKDDLQFLYDKSK